MSTSATTFILPYCGESPPTAVAVRADWLPADPRPIGIPTIPVVGLIFTWALFFTIILLAALNRERRK